LGEEKAGTMAKKTARTFKNEKEAQGGIDHPIRKSDQGNKMAQKKTNDCSHWGGGGEQLPHPGGKKRL